MGAPRHRDVPKSRCRESAGGACKPRHAGSAGQDGAVPHAHGELLCDLVVAQNDPVKSSVARASSLNSGGEGHSTDRSSFTASEGHF